MPESTSHHDPNGGVRVSLGRALGAGYRLERELGGGGMSHVFVAEDLSLGRRVVVKVLPPSLSASVDVRRFQREVALAAKWQHPHIVPLLAAGTGEGLLYYIMPLVDGESLEARIARQGALPLNDAVRILREVTDAIAHAHAAGVLHRDIKPANVLLSGRHAFVVDFGVARALVSSAAGHSTGSDGSGRLTAVGMAMGTPAYMAPEQALADPDIDHRADLYALGVLAFETLTGALPFSAPTPHALVRAHVTQPPPPVASCRDGLPAALAALVDQLLAKDPEHRPATATDVLQILEGLGALSDGVTAGHAAPGRSAPARRPWRGPTLIGVVALAGVAALLPFSRDRSTTETDASAVVRSTRPTILVSDFRAPGADSSLGPVAVEAVRTGLAQSSALAVLSPAAVGEALVRMQRAADSRLNETLARELALREGVTTIVDGSITSVGSGYIVGVRLVRPGTGEELAAFRESAADLRRLLPVIDRLTRELRERLGESQAAVDATPPLDRVTTASLPALRQYTDGMRAAALGNLEEATRHFRSALTLDSTFAMAYRALATTLIKRSAPTAQIDSAAEQAYRLRERLPERERLLTTAAYFQGTQWAPARDRARAAQAYAGVLSLAPDDPDALLDYAFQRRLRRDFRGADSLYRRAIAIRPTVSSIGALASALLAQQRPLSADSVIEDGMRRFPDSGVDEWYRVVRAHERGAYDEVADRLDSLSRSSDANTRLGATLTQPDHLLLRGQLTAYAARMTEAQSATDGGGNATAVRNALTVAALLVQVDGAPGPAIARVTAIMGASSWAALPILAQAEATLQAAAILARAGEPRRARLLVDRVEGLEGVAARRQSFAPMVQSVLAEIALTEGRPMDALRFFARADSLPDGPSDDCAPCLAAQQGRAYEQAGLADSAIAAYERSLATPDPYRLWYGTWWHMRDPVMRPFMHERLAMLHAQRGNVTRAAHHDSAFVALWSTADAPLQPRVTAARLRLQRTAAMR